jgi:peptide/nickel transport system substrate-binding protein
MKKSRLLTSGLVLLVAVLFLFAACAPQEEDAAVVEDEQQFEGVAEISYEEWEIGQAGGEIVLPALSDPRSFNTIVAQETSSTDILDRLYAGLVRRNQLTLEFEPWAAESWEISDDERTITFTLREGMTWHDGEPVTPSDWVDAVNNVYYNEEIEGAGSTRNALRGAGGDSIWEVVGDDQVRVTLPNVYAGIFQISSVSPLPMHIIQPVLDEEGAAGIDALWGVDTDVTEVVGNGPFRLAEYVPEQRVVIERFDGYFESDEEGTPLPYLDRVIFTTIPDQDTQLQNFLAGEVDFLGVRGEDYAVVVDRKEDVGFEMYNVGPASSTQFITFNQNPIEGEDDAGIEPPVLTWMSNKTFRQAMAHLVDRQTIIDNIAFGFGYPQYSFVPTFSPYYWDGAEEAAFPYDPQAAQDKLDSIDYVDRDGDGFREDPDGNRISFQLSTNSGNRVREAIGELFAQEAAAVGIEITFQPVDFNVLVGQLLNTYDWESILIGLTGSLDPISGVNVYPSDGNLHMIEPSQESPRREWEERVDEAWQVANFTTDEEQRRRGWQTIQEIWIEEVPWVFTFNPAVIHAYDTRFGNIKPHPVDGLGFGGISTRIFVRDQE